MFGASFSFDAGGTLKKSIGIKKLSKKGQSPIRYVTTILPRKGGYAWYAHLVEFGTRPHSIQTANRLGQRRFQSRSGGGVLMHPGTKAQPFMRPAFDEGKEIVIKNMAKRLEKFIEKKAKMGTKVA